MYNIRRLLQMKAAGKRYSLWSVYDKFDDDYRKEDAHFVEEVSNMIKKKI